MCKSSAELQAALETLKGEVRALSARVAVLEGRPTPEVSEPVTKPNGLLCIHPAPKPAEEIPEETVLVISAAVAAFLGERRHIRQIRLISSRSWAAQGRVSIQASHSLHH